MKLENTENQLHSTLGSFLREGSGRHRGVIPRQEKQSMKKVLITGDASIVIPHLARVLR
jgi:hypothetical protein